MADDRIVAVGLLSAQDLEVLGRGFRRAIPVEDVDQFDALIRAIDEADQRHRSAQERSNGEERSRRF